MTEFNTIINSFLTMISDALLPLQILLQLALPDLTAWMDKIGTLATSNGWGTAAMFGLGLLIRFPYTAIHNWWREKERKGIKMDTIALKTLIEIGERIHEYRGSKDFGPDGDKNWVSEDHNKTWFLNKVAILHIGLHEANHTLSNKKLKRKIDSLSVRLFDILKLEKELASKVTTKSEKEDLVSYRKEGEVLSFREIKLYHQVRMELWSVDFKHLILEIKKYINTGT